MSRFDLANVDFQELIKLREELDASIEERREEEKQQLLQDIRQMVLANGFSMGEIFSGGELVKERRVIEPKYQNPDNLEQKWSGRGRKPACGW
uniref:DNA-binding protein H-NS n=1 Tax=Candidatus Kentrum sp. FM TaxID=2126340 RepID=A0A450T8D3_9GAMM|nr:MAG: DNA-binding protein H-NS [Candidatus Kentron sp. FM]VFJ62976.1 MAG: DNA-binding protein H-NS [Candidatus Kentron sp. FM]VFK14306.1 MAG: DNA-binding protein H-NS [Candidatus Kentron sp. FM]